MSRQTLNFLRPYLYRASRPLQPEHKRAYLSLQRRLVQTIATDAYTGPHDVEKQKRLEQLGKVKSLNEYHPRLLHPTGAESLSIRDFNAKYDGLEETKPDLVSVFGMIQPT
jgi:lysyl-tRNA synthetase class 2